MTKILFFILITPLIGGLILIFLPKKEIYIIREIGFLSCFITFIGIIFLWLKFDYFTGLFQFAYISENYIINFIFLQFILGIDGFSLIFILLTSLIIPICLWSVFFKKVIFLNLYFSFFLILQFSILGAFLSLDLFLFFLFFEIILIPMFFLIGIWGSTIKKIQASFFFLLYTIFGSSFFFFSIFIIFLEFQTTNFYYIFFNCFSFSTEKQLLLWWLFFFGLGVKIPIFPLHLWLPEAHVEASTEGSIILASLLLKLGGYGFLRTSLPLCPEATIYFIPLLYCFCLTGIFYSSFIALKQNDLKKIVAYSSIGHMNLITIGIFSINLNSLQGSVHLMVGHALSSSGLFFLIGSLYDRHKSRLINYYSGLLQVMPLFSSFFFFFSLTNISFPGTANFVGEILIITGLLNSNYFITIGVLITTILTLVYTIWMFNKLIFGSIKLRFITFYTDLFFWEVEISIFFLFLIIYLGINPNLILNISHFSSLFLLLYY